ncbi:RNA methyltransferase, TrmH family [Flavobacteriaceae bacterium MAR_2010_188]|nr:RNA methyltransferase, TrmH family [Flavobacteriaceae bacterium MAR_2010_188]
MTKNISSVQNPEIKHLIQLKEKSRERKKSGKFIIEGKRELSLAIKGGYKIDSVYFYPKLFSESQAKSLERYHISITEISQAVFEKLAHRSSTEGVIAVAKEKPSTLETLNFKDKNPLILIAEAPEKPGNIGALLRTADAANVDAVIIANPKTDLYNPNIIRSSVGCVFTNQIAMAPTAEIIFFLKNNDIEILCAALDGAVQYDKVDMTKPSAIVVGTEATGLTQSWLKFSDQNIIIPMQGEIDSMNVSVAAGILIFEAKRQRGFK